MIDLLKAINNADAWISSVAMLCTTFLIVYFNHKDEK